MINLRGQGLVMTIRKIWSIKPYKQQTYYDLEYDYDEDAEKEQIKYEDSEEEEHINYG
jgi:hypothetical protein